MSNVPIIEKIRENDSKTTYYTKGVSPEEMIQGGMWHVYLCSHCNMYLFIKDYIYIISVQCIMFISCMRDGIVATNNIVTPVIEC